MNEVREYCEKCGTKIDASHKGSCPSCNQIGRKIIGQVDETIGIVEDANFVIRNTDDASRLTKEELLKEGFENFQTETIFHTKGTNVWTTISSTGLTKIVLYFDNKTGKIIGRQDSKVKELEQIDQISRKLTELMKGNEIQEKIATRRYQSEIIIAALFTVLGIIVGYFLRG